LREVRTHGKCHRGAFSLGVFLPLLVACGGCETSAWDLADGGADAPAEEPVDAAPDLAPTPDAEGDDGPFRVLSTQPPAGAGGVARDVVVSAIFNRDVDPATVAFTLTCKTCDHPYQWKGAVTQGNQVLFTPSERLYYSKTYQAEIDGGVASLEGEALANGYSWSFTTAGPAQGLGLDPDFGVGGVIEDAIGAPAAAHAVVAQADGTLLVAGEASGDLLLARFYSTGNLDATFGNGGFVTTAVGQTVTGKALSVGADGSATVAGALVDTEGLVVARYLSNGTLDTTFGSGGVVITPTPAGYEVGRGLSFGAQGTIVGAGAKIDPYPGTREQYALARYNADGTWDTTFGEAGLHADPPLSNGTQGLSHVVVEGDGRICASGGTSETGYGGASLRRYGADGTFEEELWTEGGHYFYFCSLGLGLDADGHVMDVLCSGASDDVFHLCYCSLWRNMDGFFTGIDLGGLSTKLTAVASHLGGKSVAAGVSGGDLLVVRLGADGVVDPSFGEEGATLVGVSQPEANAIAVLPDGRIVVAGTSGDRLLLVRFLP
jgi:uncharacterized delta-60 repeat protein